MVKATLFAFTVFLAATGAGRGWQAWQADNWSDLRRWLERPLIDAQLTKHCADLMLDLLCDKFSMESRGLVTSTPPAAVMP